MYFICNSVSYFFTHEDTGAVDDLRRAQRRLPDRAKGRLAIVESQVFRVSSALLEIEEASPRFGVLSLRQLGWSFTNSTAAPPRAAGTSSPVQVLDRDRNRHRQILHRKYSQLRLHPRRRPLSTPENAAAEGDDGERLARARVRLPRLVPPPRRDHVRLRWPLCQSAANELHPRAQAG